ncbi:hypothetical protein [Microcella flavibacter]|uniref:hypothetical protein n=1 Tax=Microcella flavibacter TaxID=1804990 RepID=UPI00145791D4|nr:hypothetical protein [Microcella flavibacter]
MRIWDTRAARAVRAALGARLGRIPADAAPATTPGDGPAGAPDGERTDEDFEQLVHEGALVALSAVRLATKNGLILSTLRDRTPWREEQAIAIARRALLDLIDELEADADRIEIEARTAAAAARAARVASVSSPGSRRSRTERTRLRNEVKRLDARERSMRGVVARLRATAADDALRHEVVLRARDDALGELVHARLIPRGPAVALSPEEEREAIAGIKADLARLLEDHEGY